MVKDCNTVHTVFQDPTDFVIERAISYTIPHGKELPPMYFLLICYFGMKRPIFSAFHLSMCDEKTLLILQDENAITVLLLQKYKHGKFHISFQVASYKHNSYQFHSSRFLTL